MLIDAKFAHNVGTALRSCALLGVGHLFWTGQRVPSIDSWPDGSRIPREERMRCYQRTRMQHIDGYRPVSTACQGLMDSGVPSLIPVCVEISDSAEDLRDFAHPENALYVFGPEDGGVPQSIRRACHRFVRIPNAIPGDDIDSRTPYNLSAAVNILLYDRLSKSRVPVYA